jgi:hypothetical protein
MVQQMVAVLREGEMVKLMVAVLREEGRWSN